MNSSQIAGAAAPGATVFNTVDRNTGAPMVQFETGGNVPAATALLRTCCSPGRSATWRAASETSCRPGRRPADQHHAAPGGTEPPPPPRAQHAGDGNPAALAEGFCEGFEGVSAGFVRDERYGFVRDERYGFVRDER